MRVILAGQKSFGKAVYERLLSDGHEVAGVWSPTARDFRQSDDWDKLTALAFRDDVYVPDIRRIPECVDTMGVDLFVAAHSHDFIGRASRAATRLGGIGFHPSLLPRHRGRDAVRWTVHMGDPIAGGSVYWLTDNVDGGPIAAQDWCFVFPSETATTLWSEVLFDMGVELISKVLDDLTEPCATMIQIPQDELYATWEPSWERPPLYRPELPQIGSVDGFTHVTSKSQIRSAEDFLSSRRGGKMGV